MPQRTAATAEEVAFFDKVSAYLGDKPLYHEFLKLLNLYTQDIIELHVLVARAKLFLADHRELWQEFREMVGWHDGTFYLGGRIDRGGEWILDHVPLASLEDIKPDLESERKSGPCYRKLPESVRLWP